MNASTNAFNQIVDKGYACEYTFKLYGKANAPYVLPDLDDIKIKVGVAGLPAVFEADTASTPSKVVIVTRGQVNAAPCEIKIKIAAEQSTLLDKNETYQLDIIHVDNTTDPETPEDYLLTSGGLTVRDTVLPVEVVGP